MGYKYTCVKPQTSNAYSKYNWAQVGAVAPQMKVHIKDLLLVIVKDQSSHLVYLNTCIK